MSDLMLCGVLRMPMPHDPSNLGLVEWMQIKERMAQAAQELEQRAARIEALERQVKAADALAEAVTHEREMVCQDFGMQQDAATAVHNALAAYRATKEGGA